MRPTEIEVREDTARGSELQGPVRIQCPVQKAQIVNRTWQQQQASRLGHVVSYFRHPWLEKKEKVPTTPP